MNNKITELRIFTIADWEKEEQYLQKRHKEGWKLVRISFPMLYHFEKCFPEDMVYQLDYGRDGGVSKDEYLQRRRENGWEYIQSFAGYNYFRKPVDEVQGQTDAFCDDKSRLDRMRRMFMWRYLPILILLLLILPNLFWHSPGTEAGTPVLMVLFLAVLTAYVWAAVSFGCSYWKVKKRLHK